MALTKCKECGEEISKKAEKCPKCGAPAKKKTSLFTWLVTIVLAIGAVGYFSGNSGPGPSSGASTSGSPPSSGASSKRKPSSKEVALKNVTLDFSWSKTGFDSVMEADFKITNNSRYQIKDIEISCVHFAKSGTRIDSNKRTIYDVVPAKSTKMFRKFNMGFIRSQVVKTGCTISDLKV